MISVFLTYNCFLSYLQFSTLGYDYGICHISSGLISLVGPHTKFWKNPDMESSYDGSDEWGSFAETWDTQPSVVEYSVKAFESLNTIADIQNARVLDFGCGTGLLTTKIAATAKSVVALDSSPKMINVLNSKNFSNVTTISDLLTDNLVSTTESLKEPFDLIVASSVCAFLPDFDESLNILTSLLRVGGQFVQWDWLSQEEDEFGFTEEKLRSAYKRVSLEVISISTPFSVVAESSNSSSANPPSDSPHPMEVIMAVGMKGL